MAPKAGLREGSVRVGHSVGGGLNNYKAARRLPGRIRGSTCVVARAPPPYSIRLAPPGSTSPVLVRPKGAGGPGARPRLSRTPRDAPERDTPTALAAGREELTRHADHLFITADPKSPWQPRRRPLT